MLTLRTRSILSTSRSSTSKLIPCGGVFYLCSQSPNSYQTHSLVHESNERYLTRSRDNEEAKTMGHTRAASSGCNFREEDIRGAGIAARSDARASNDGRFEPNTVRQIE